MNEIEPCEPFASRPSLDQLVANGSSIDDYLECEHRRLIREAMKKTNGNKTAAASLLKVGRTTLVMRIKALF